MFAADRGMAQRDVPSDLIRASLACKLTSKYTTPSFATNAIRIHT